MCNLSDNYIKVKRLIREMKKSRTRESIIEAALEEFSSKGIRESSIESIAERAEVARRTFYNHFNDKDELLFEIIDTRLETAIDEVKGLAAGNNGIDDLSDFCLRFWSEDSRHIQLMRILQEERIGKFSKLHGIFLTELKQLLIIIDKKTPLRFKDPNLNLRLIFTALFPILEIISAEQGFESDFREIFGRLLIRQS